jgi:four helix bundle protein
VVAGRSSLVAGKTTVPRGYRDLEVYQRSLDALVRVHELAATFPDVEKFELASQLRRASKSVPANIAEGYAKRRSPRHFVSFLTTALGSANEVEVHLDIAAKLGYLEENAVAEVQHEYGIIGRQLASLIRSWQAKRPGTSDQ